MSLILMKFVHPVFAFLDVGGPELLLIFLLILVLFGGKRLPELAKGLGKSIREFKRATAGVEEQLKRAMEEEPEQPKPRRKLPATQTPANTTPANMTPADTTAIAAATVTSGSTTSDQSSADAYEDVDPYADEYIGGRPVSDNRPSQSQSGAKKSELRQDDIGNDGGGI